jgi:ATP phosphoribosyltransferase
MEENLKIAIQKSGRLSQKSLQLLEECGISFNLGTNTLKTQATNFPIELLLLRDDDIPAYVSDGVADIGILGENVVIEKGYSLHTIERLGFGKCRLSLAVPKQTDYQGIEFFNHKRIATSYPNLLQSFLDQQGIKADIHFISGSVEIAPSIGLADGICDIVSSGSTLLSNGLKEVAVVLRSEAILVANPTFNGSKRAIFEKLLFRIRAVQRSSRNKYILLNAPSDNLQEIISILPGLKSPTVLPLAEEGWVSVHSVIEEDVFWEKIDALQQAGAQGILVVPIEKMVV